MSESSAVPRNASEGSQLLQAHEPHLGLLGIVVGLVLVLEAFWLPSAGATPPVRSSLLALGLAIFALGARSAWRTRLEAIDDTSGAYAPTMWRLQLSLLIIAVVALLASIGAVALAGVLFGQAAGQVPLRDQAAAGISLLTPVAAAVAALFVYRRNRTAHASARREDFALSHNRFIHAVGLLADGDPRTMIGAVLALGSLAREAPRLQVQCVETICGLLRSPQLSTVPVGDNDENENVVRRLAIAELSSIFRPTRSTSPTYPGSLLDLRGAWLGEGADFSRCVFPCAVDMSGSTCNGSMNFTDTRFERELRLHGLKVTGDVQLERAISVGTVSISGKIHGDVRANDMRMRANLESQSLVVKGDFLAQRALVDGKATFDEITVSGELRFEDAIFGAEAGFENSTIHKRAAFARVLFLGDANFFTARFQSAGSFEGTRFKGDAQFSGAQFGHAGIFDDAVFAAAARFRATEFGIGQAGRMTRFIRTKFERTASFIDSRFHKSADFSLAYFGEVSSFAECRLALGDDSIESSEFTDRFALSPGSLIPKTAFNGHVIASDRRVGPIPWSRQKAGQ